MKNNSSSKKASKKLTSKLIAEFPAFMGFPWTSEGISFHGGPRHPVNRMRDKKGI
jgi:hypothetical protein